MSHVNSLSQSERVNLIGSLIPDFSIIMGRLRDITIKYQTLTNRLNPQGTIQSTALQAHGLKIKELLQSDKFARKIKLVEDLAKGR